MRFIKKHLRIIVYGIIITAVITGTFFLLTSNVRLAFHPLESIVKELTSQVSSAAGVRIKYSGVTTNILNSVYITDFEIRDSTANKDNVIAVIDAVIIKYNIFKILFSRDNKVAGVNQIVLDNPKIKVTSAVYKKVSGLMSLSQNSGQKVGVKDIKLLIHNGQVDADKDYGIYLHDVNSAVSYRGNVLSLKLAVRNTENQRVPVTFTVNAEVNNKELNCGVAVKNFDISTISLYRKYINASVLDNLASGYAGGEFRFKLPLEDTKKTVLSPLEVQGKFKLSNAAVQITSGTYVQEIYAEGVVNNTEIQMERLTAKIGKTVIHGSGVAENIYVYPKVKAELRTYNGQVEDIISLLPVVSTAVYRGSLNASLLLEGTTTQFEGKAVLTSVNTRVGALKVDSIKLDTVFNNRGVKINECHIAVDGGIAVLHGNIKNYSELTLKLNTRKMAMEVINTVMGAKLPVSVVDMTADITGNIKKPVVDAEYSIFLGSDVKPGIKGGVKYKIGDSIVVNGNIEPWGVVYDALVEIKDPEYLWVLKSGSLSTKQGHKLVKSNGTFFYNTGKLNFAVYSDKIKLQSIAFLADISKQVEGEVKLEGKLGGILTAPVAKLNLFGNETSLGNISSTIDYAGSADNYVVNAKMYAGDEKKAGVTFECRLTRDLWETKKFIINQHGGKVDISAALKTDDKSGTQKVLALKAGVDNFAVGPAKVSADIVINGSLTGTNVLAAVLTAQNVAVNKYGISDITGKVEYAGGRVNLRDWYSRDGKLKSALTLNLNDSNIAFTGQCIADNLPLQMFVSMLNPELVKNVGGMVDNTLNLTGTAERPVLKIDTSVREGSYDKQKFVCTAKSVLVKNIVTSQVNFIPTGGKSVEFNLNAVYGKNNELKVKAELDRLEAANIVIEGITLDSVVTKKRVVINSGKFNIFNGTVLIAEGTEVGFDTANKTGSMKGTYVINSELRNISLVQQLNLYGKAAFRGDWVYDNVNGLRFEALASTKRFWVNEHNFEYGNIHFAYSKNMIMFMPVDNSEYQIMGELEFNNLPEVVFKDFAVRNYDSDVVSVKGTIGGKQNNLSIQGKTLPLGTLTALLNQKISVTGDTVFHLIISGTPELMLLNGRLESNNGTIANLPFERLNTLFTIQGTELKVRDLYISNKDLYLFTGSGNMQLASGKDKDKGITGPASINVKLANGNLRFLKNIFGIVKKSDGMIDGEVELKIDNLQRTRVDGNLRITNCNIALKDVFNQINGLNVELTLKDDEVIVDHGHARIGKGELGLSGKVELAGFGINRYDIKLKTLTQTGIALNVQWLAIPKSMFFKRVFNVPSTGEAIVDVSLAGTASAPVIRGLVELNNASFIYPPSESADTGTAQFDAAVLDNTVWDLVLKTGQNVWYKNENIDLQANGQVAFANRTKDLKVNGLFESIRGNANYLGRSFDIRRARLEIVNNETYLEATAETEGNIMTPSGTEVATKVTMNIDRTRIAEIKPRFSAQDYPNLPEEKVVLYLFGFSEKSLDMQGQQTKLRTEVIRMFGSSIAAPFMETIAAPLVNTGIVDKVKVTQTVSRQATTGDSGVPVGDDAQSVSFADFLNGTKTTFEKIIAPDLAIGYSMQFADKLSLWHEVELSYKWKQLLFKGTIKDKSIFFSNDAERRISIEHVERFGGWEEEK